MRKTQNTTALLTKRVRLLTFVAILLLALTAGSVTAFANTLTTSNQTPANLSTIESSTPLVSVYVKSTSAKINSSSATLTFNGKSVTPRFVYKGHYEYDSCGGSYYVIDSYYEGTVQYQATNLVDGTYPVAVSIADVNGNSVSTSWQFTVGKAPKFSSLTPANNTLANNTEGILVSAKVTDDVAVNGSSIVLTLNGETKSPAYDSATGLISYREHLADGVYNAKVIAKDTAGNQGSAEWSFRVSNDATPTVSSLYPSVSQTVYVRNPVIKVNVKDTFDDLNSKSATLVIDGTAVTPTFNYLGHWEYDSCYGDYYVIDSYKEGTIEFQPSYLKDGAHWAEISIKDAVGNTLTKRWNFNVSTKPAVSDVQPAPSYISSAKPVITAKITDVDPEDGIIKLFINGVETEGWTFNTTTKVFTYTPVENLENEKMHTVKIEASDMGGATSYSWKFYVNTYPDMPDANISNCASCHSYDKTAPIEFQAMHNGVSFYGSHSSNQCDACHNYITYPADCLQCHGLEDGTGWIDEAPHGSTPSIKYQLKGYNPETPMRVTTNREMTDCIICHQPGSPVLGWEGYWVKPTKQLNNHDIPELHKTSDTSCIKCHALSLTREHARAERVDNAGNAITCNTCHLSTDTKVKAAITNNDTSCSACHENANHEEMHEVQLNGCTTCHASAISSEHSNRGYTCGTCHDGTSSVSSFAINWNQRVCSDCHQSSTAHSVNFAKSVPADVPKYSSATVTLDWLTPEKTSFWLGEPWVPADMTDGMFTMSSRNAALTGTEVYTFYTNFYNSKASEGWAKVSGPDAASDKFELVYQNDKKKVYIRFYNTLKFTSEDAVNYGGRIELLYK